MLIQWLSVAAGVLVLYLGGEVLVRFATALARALGVRPLLIGLTVIAFGTSAPELAAAVLAAAQGLPAIAVGNVVGSNIANIGLILGVTVLLGALPADRRFVRREVPFMIGAGALLIPFILTGSLNRWHGAILLLMMGWFLWMMAKDRDIEFEIDEPGENDPGKLVAALGSVVGLVMLIGGAQLLVWGAEQIARGFGISERVIGLTVVAFGTSVPELAGCLVAAARKQSDLVLGNIIGSNIFNTLLILPSAILVRPLEVTFAGFGTDLLVMVAFSVVLLIFFLSGDRLVRTEGIVLLVAYFAYVGYLAASSIPA